MSSRRLPLVRKSNVDRLDAPTPSRREHGLWSFLTWSFFLSQVVAAESLLGSAARAAEGEGTAGAPSVSAAQAALAPAKALEGVRTAESESSAAIQAAAANENAGQSKVAAGPGVQSGDDIAHANGDGAATSSAHAQGSVSAIQAAAGSGDEPGLLTVPLLPDLDGGGTENPLGPIIDDTLGPLVGPVIGLVDDVIDSLDSLLDPLVSPVIDVLGDTVVPVVVAVADIAEALLQPVTGLIGETIAPVASILEPVLASALDTVGPIVQPVGAIVNQVDTLSDTLGLQGLVGSTGNIVVAELAVGGSLHLDDLFNDGRYTDYNIALGSGQSVDTAVLPVAGETLAISILGDTSGADVDGNTAHHTVGPLGHLGGLLDDAHSRGLGEALGL